MARLLLLVISIALADAVNPGTLGPALYLATTPRARARIAAFAGAFFVVNLAAGVLVVLGPGQLLLAALPHVSPTARFVIELVAGALLLAVGLLLLATGRSTGEPGRSELELGRRGAGALGATIAAVELPTAFPYFAALAAIVSSGRGLGAQLLLVGAFNVVFIAPVLSVVAILAVAGARGEAALRRAGDWLGARWRQIFAVVALVAGVLLMAFGATALLGLR